jgi:type IV secretory pathway TraG/TraD family ATPase VirD4
MFNMLPSPLWFVLYLALALVAIGAGLTLLYGIVRGMLWCLGLTRWLLSYTWARLTGRPPSSWGTAHWASEPEIAAKGLFQEGGIPLGTWQGKPLYESMGGHVALIGPPRSRKSWGLLMPAIDRFDGSILVHDPRGELWEHTHAAREARGPTFKFSPTQKESCSINVLDAVRWGEAEAFGDVQRCIHGLLSPDPGEAWNDFRLEAEPLLVAMVFDRQAAGAGNLPAVLHWMTSPAQSMTEKAKSLLQSPITAVSAGGRRFLDKSDRLQSSVWSAALSALTIYQDPLVAAHTEHSDVDLSDLQHGTRPVSIFLTPPFADVARLRSLLGTLTEMLVSRFSAQQDTPRQKVLLALDEIGNLGRLTELERGMSFLQGCGVQVLAVLQNIQQFRFTYGHDSPLLASVGTHVYYTPGDPETADYLSEQLGVKTERLRPESQTFTFWGLFSHRTIGTSEHARQLLTSDETRRLDEHAMVCLVKGLAPILGRKLGTPAPETVDVASPWRKVAMVTAACVSLALIAWIVSWIPDKGPTPPPSTALSLPTETQPSTPPHTSVFDTWGRPPTSESGRRATFGEWASMRQQKSWALLDFSENWTEGQTRMHHWSPMPMPGGMFSTKADCEVARLRNAEITGRMLAGGPLPPAGWTREIVNDAVMGVSGQRSSHKAGKWVHHSQSLSFCAPMGDVQS